MTQLRSANGAIEPCYLRRAHGALQLRKQTDRRPVAIIIYVNRRHCISDSSFIAFVLF